MLHQALHPPSHVMMGQKVQHSERPRRHQSPRLVCLERPLHQEVHHVGRAGGVPPSGRAPAGLVVQRAAEGQQVARRIPAGAWLLLTTALRAHALGGADQRCQGEKARPAKAAMLLSLGVVGGDTPDLLHQRRLIPSTLGSLVGSQSVRAPTPAVEAASADE